MSERHRPTRRDVYDALMQQYSSGSWSNGFDPRSIDEDPLGLGIFDPSEVYFQKPEDSDNYDVDELRQFIGDSARLFFIDDESWEAVGDELSRIFEDSSLVEFVRSQNGNLFIFTPHLQFHDLGILAAKSLEVRQELPKDNPFHNDQDPAAGQIIVANRVLAMLKHPDFEALTRYPILEGLMLPIADVLTTISSSGSGHRVRGWLGRHKVQHLNDQTNSQLLQLTTQGGKIIFVVPSGNQADKEQVDGFSEAYVVGEARHGLADIIVKPNEGSESTHKNAIAGLFIDCQSIRTNGSIAPPEHFSVKASPELWVPTSRDELHLTVRAMLRLGVGINPAEFRYGLADRDSRITPREEEVLGRITL